MRDADGFANLGIDDAYYEGWKAEAAVRKRRISAAPSVQQYLERLRAAGADADKILIGLDLVASDNTRFYKSWFAKKERDLKALASKLERVSTEIQSVLSNPFYSSDFNAWNLMPLGYKPLNSLDRLEARAENIRKRTKPILELLRGEATALRSLRRNYPTIVSIRLLRGLLRYVKESTGEYHDRLMADLLQAAHDTLGVDATFSEEKLRKLRQRKMPDLIRTQKRKQLPHRKLDNSIPQK